MAHNHGSGWGENEAWSCALAVAMAWSLYPFTTVSQCTLLGCAVRQMKPVVEPSPVRLISHHGWVARVIVALVSLHALYSHGRLGALLFGSTVLYDVCQVIAVGLCWVARRAV